MFSVPDFWKHDHLIFFLIKNSGSFSPHYSKKVYNYNLALKGRQLSHFEVQTLGTQSLIALEDESKRPV